MNEIIALARPEQHDMPSGGQLTGVRLHACEVYNWGTFHGRAWRLDPAGNNALLTGDIGSGKSTLVDAVTTLLVPSHKASYNKAAGAETRERDLKSYVLGYYKAERADSGLAAKPVALRTNKNYSVILGRFRNEGFAQDVTLAQVFWIRDTQAQPARFYVVADRQLSIAEHFSNFGADPAALKKRLRSIPDVEVFDSFPPYGSAFRRRFGIENEQALDLFHQTVSMKSVGNLTDFVRQHMLEAFPVEQRVDALIAHFDDLNRAHEAVLKAKAQIAALSPLVADCDAHAHLTSEVAALRACRAALRGYFSELKAGLLEARLRTQHVELERLAERIGTLDLKLADERNSRDEIKRAIAENGGDRIDSLTREIAQKQSLLDERKGRSDQYERMLRNAGLPAAHDDDAFLANRETISSAIESARVREAELQNRYTEESVAFRQLKSQHNELEYEIESLRKRRSNIPARALAIRERLCESLHVEETHLPFTGELIEVRKEESTWEGAAERVLHNFALSLLVSDEHYAQVADWVDRTHLGDRLVYYRVRNTGNLDTSRLHARSLAHKLAIRPDSAFYSWLEAEIGRRFDYACCDNLDQFRREESALTRAGQFKGRGVRHEKDDRHLLDDRTRYVLGWSNEAKIAALQAERTDFERRLAAAGKVIANLEREQNSLRERLSLFNQIAVFERYRDLDWRPLAIEIESLGEERRRLEEGSDILRTLNSQLAQTEGAIKSSETQLQDLRHKQSQLEDRRGQAQEMLGGCKAELASVSDAQRTELFPRLSAMRETLFPEHRLAVETCDSRERDMREKLQADIDAEDKKIAHLLEKIIRAMQAYNQAYPLDTREVDVAIGSVNEYRSMLTSLETDGLPHFETRFKELLNENTIREIANFQSQLARERRTILDRIGTINESLRKIDYNPGRYIMLEAQATPDPEVRDFQQDLRACTEGAFTASDDQYSEAKFLQVKDIVERFRGRDGSAELDRRWTHKVTDVRNWFMFSASERWREDDREHEHYSDTGGKSGGQKEKLAYTVLAASLAYQFGLEWSGKHSHSFRFVVIDEAFGRGSDESAKYALELFHKLNLQLLIVTPLQKIHIIEPYVSAVGFVHNPDGKQSLLRNLTIEEYRAEQAARAG